MSESENNVEGTSFRIPEVTGAEDMTPYAIQLVFTANRKTPEWLKTNLVNELKAQGFLSNEEGFDDINWLDSDVFVRAKRAYRSWLQNVAALSEKQPKGRKKWG